jgi:hypothetical protein
MVEVVARKNKSKENLKHVAQPKPSKLGLRLQAISDRALKSGIPSLSNRQIHQGIRSML